MNSYLSLGIHQRIQLKTALSGGRIGEQPVGLIMPFVTIIDLKLKTSAIFNLIKK